MEQQEQALGCTQVDLRSITKYKYMAMAWANEDYLIENFTSIKKVGCGVWGMTSKCTFDLPIILYIDTN